MNDNNNTCTIVNTVWINKGIFLTILYYILKKYDILLDKIIIIDITRFRLLFKLLFPRLTFKKYEIDNKNNFYFNIRTIIKKQDVIIDYLNSYDSFIPTRKISLVPWFDMNDILISYTYNKKKKLYIDKYLNFIINFNKCRRGNYNNQIYDNFIENNIINRFLLFNTDYTLTKLNKLLITYLNNYTDTVNNYILEPNNHIKSTRKIKPDININSGSSIITNTTSNINNNNGSSIINNSSNINNNSGSNIITNITPNIDNRTYSSSNINNNTGSNINNNITSNINDKLTSNIIPMIRAVTDTIKTAHDYYDKLQLKNNNI